MNERKNERKKERVNERKKERIDKAVRGIP